MYVCIYIYTTLKSCCIHCNIRPIPNFNCLFSHVARWYFHHGRSSTRELPPELSSMWRMQKKQSMKQWIKEPKNQKEKRLFNKSTINIRFVFFPKISLINPWDFPWFYSIWINLSVESRDPTSGRDQIQPGIVGRAFPSFRGPGCCFGGGNPFKKQNGKKKTGVIILFQGK